MTNITKPTSAALKKWKLNATRAAAHLKSTEVKPKPGETFIRAGFAFDDDQSGIRIITLDITLTDIANMTGQELTDHIYNGVLQKALEQASPEGNA